MNLVLMLILVFSLPARSSSPTVEGDGSWYDPPAYGVTWEHVMGKFEEWGRLQGLGYDLAHPYCAMRDFPIGSLVEVTWNDTSTMCYVVDYGPDASVFPERVIDLSSEIFQQFAPLSQGVLHGVTVSLINTDHCGPASFDYVDAPVSIPVREPPFETLLRITEGGLFVCWPI